LHFPLGVFQIAGLLRDATWQYNDGLKKREILDLPWIWIPAWAEIKLLLSLRQLRMPSRETTTT
jgi:hypothetical protein